MNDDDDGPPMLVSSENVGEAESSLNAEMADAQIKKVPISIITGEFIPHLTDYTDPARGRIRSPRFFLKLYKAIECFSRDEV